MVTDFGSLHLSLCFFILFYVSHMNELSAFCTLLELSDSLATCVINLQIPTRIVFRKFIIYTKNEFWVC